MGRVLIEILNPVLVNKEIGLRVARDPDDVLIVVLDPASHFLSIDKFHHNRRAAFGQAIDVFGFAESRFRRGLPTISPARVLIRSSYSHAPKYSGFDVKIQE